MDEGRAIFLQIAEALEDSILDGSLAEGERAPSTNELAAFHQINPATAARGINLLVEHGVLVKRRGIGMFVAEGAKEMLITRRRHEFAAQYIAPLLAEARALGMTNDDVVDMLRSADAPQTQATISAE